MNYITNDNFLEKALEFTHNPPYKNNEYSGRNWGHPWHSLCSYHGKLKPSIAHHLIKNFTNENDLVLDPMSGVGTIPFEASLQGRYGIGNDLSELAYMITKAKLSHPSREKVENVLLELEDFINFFKQDYELFELPYQNFGLNKKIPDYFEKKTYSEILAARTFFSNKTNNISEEEALVFSCFAHVLHGNRPYALSRNSHPLTPYAPTGEFIYKNVIEHIRKKVDLSYKKGDFSHFKKGEAILGDLFSLSDIYKNEVDVIITSPPFINSIKFFNNNWMRLWLSGWEPSDFKKADKRFIESKQNIDFSIYKDFFNMCNSVLKSSGSIILHLGKSKNFDMGEEIIQYIPNNFELIHLGLEDTSKIERHGIRDKGSTTHHQFLFIKKNS